MEKTLKIWREDENQWHVIYFLTMKRLSLILFPLFQYFVSIYFWNMMSCLRLFFKLSALSEEQNHRVNNNYLHKLTHTVNSHTNRCT